MTREEFEQYAIKNNLVVWSKEQSESAIKALEELPKRRTEAKRWKTKAAQIASKQNGWIPVSERMPKDRKPVLVTAYWHETYQVMVGSYFGNGDWWCAPWNNTGEPQQLLKVKAWMPLPEPYMEESEG